MKGTATPPESLLRPREIQVRIRAGQSPETVAAAAQTSVERIMAFATPVLAERAFVAQQAAKSSVRRRSGDGPVGSLGDAVAGRLEAAGLDPESADWDAWRREDGRWTVVTQYAEAGESQQAEFTYDAIGRYVVAEDDTARWLVGERRAATPSPQVTPQLAPQLAPGSAPEEEPDGQLALGDDALRVVTGQSLPPAASPAPRPAPRLAPTAPVVALAPLDRPAATDEPTEDLSDTARAVRSVPAPPADGEGLFEDAELRAPTEVDERRRSHPSSRPRTRRSMPSWDDIMLGSAPRGD